MGLLKTRKNKKFSYSPRYYKGEGNPYEIKHKFDEHRTTIGNNNGIKAKFNNALNDYKYNPDKEADKRVLIIIGILVLIFLFIIGFDLSIFFSK
ncbi:riboflavin synthase subunit beta [Seonamhaeicola algicola]|uniref:Riboflavin synthase subunit beta n=1 Tax=Seonamhaeicola algicola TaxID=1719036 RepID=A0A5C7AME8_9FLAO|nr:riboflavin synthase subunit beta [Seonamhaeicola algicola]TXE09916.1 riboflavin synthase subunit beta [Seonamhaeicola algicola]